MQPLFRSASLAHLVGGALALAACSSEPTTKPAGGASAGAVDLEPVYATLDKIRTNLPAPAALAETACPDPQILTWSPEPRTRALALISHATLLRTTGAEVPAATASAVTGGMASFEIGWIPPRGSTTKPDTRLAARWAERHYIAVLTKAAEVVPDAAAAIGGRFEPGTFDGWLVVFRAATAEPICSVRVAASNSPKAAVTTTVNDRTDDVTRKAQLRVTEDLRRQVGLALKAAVERGSTALTIINPAV